MRKRIFICHFFNAKYMTVIYIAFSFMLLTIILVLPISLSVSAGFYSDIFPVITLKIYNIKIFEQKIDGEKIKATKKPPYFLLDAFTVKKLSLKYLCGYEKLSEPFLCTAFATAKVLATVSNKTNFDFELAKDKKEILIVKIKAATSILKILTKLLSKKGIDYGKSIRSNTANS